MVYLLYFGRLCVRYKVTHDANHDTKVVLGILKM